VDKEKGQLSPFEMQVLDTILYGDHPLLEVLREQVRVCRVTKREFTGVGFFTWLTVPTEGLVAGPNRTFTLSGASADLDGLTRGAGFVLFVTNGILDNLEGYTYDEPWPDVMGPFSIRRDELDDTRTRDTLDDVWQR
jgi:hypothetical protein